MIHFLAGPLDGKPSMEDVDNDTFLLKGDSTGWYLLHHNVAGLKTSLRSGLVLTDDDLIAQWHQRHGPKDFQVGDVVTVSPANVTGTIAFGPFGGAVDEQPKRRHWMIRSDGDPLPTVCSDDDMALS
jgi:hypothetical protein